MQSILNSTRQSSTELTPESTPKSTSKPGPKLSTIVPDTQPTWPGRPELSFREYLIEKEAWLTDNPGFHAADYRMTRGLEVYSNFWIRASIHNLPIQRLNLDAETFLQGSPHWTNEVFSAWLDWDTLQAEEVWSR